MKTNIFKCDYYGNKTNDGDWWKWTETCDRCGTVIQDESVLHSNKPNTNEADFCTICLRYFMENKKPVA